MNLRLRTPLQILCPALVVLLAAGTAMATVTYPGPFVGSTVNFENVAETTNTTLDPTDPATLFGSPTASGDSLSFDFSPNGFSASASDGTSDITSSQLTLEIVTTAMGATIGIVNLQELGLSTLSGSGTSATGTFVGLSGSTTILEQGGVDTPDIPGPAINVVFDPTNLFGLPGDSGTVNWSGVAVLDFTGFSPNATRVRLQIDDFVQAASESGTTADISKTSLAISVPEPGTMALLGLGLLGALGMGRRRT